jgi:putative tryptophan/tyrosine transport system substrate-binding protein
VEAVAAAVRSRPEIETVIAAQAGEKTGLASMPDPFMDAHRLDVLSEVNRYRIPGVYPFRFSAEAGGLMSYGNEQIDNFRRAATYVDRILNGAKVRELPIQGPTNFAMVISVKTAKALGFEVPLRLYQAADEIIE